MRDFGLFLFSLLSGTHPTHRSMCGSHRPVLLTLLSMYLLPLGTGLEIAAAGLDTSSKQLIASVAHGADRAPQCHRCFVNVLVGPVVNASAQACAAQTVIAPFTSLDVISTHPCSIHLVFLRGQVAFYSLCATLLVRVVASLLAVLEMSQHEPTIRTRVYASSCVCPARLPS